MCFLFEELDFYDFLWLSNPARMPIPKPNTISNKYKEKPAMAKSFLLSTMNAAKMKSRNTLTSDRLILLFLIFLESEYPASNNRIKIVSLKTKGILSFR